MEFLELPDSATDTDIQERLHDKQNYFERLIENAPNDFLKKLHTQNIEKVKNIRSFLLQETADPSAKPLQQHYARPESSVPLSNNSFNGSPVAFLVRHTENLSAKPFPLYAGDNYIGRSPMGNHQIVIDDDAYVSRQHAIIRVNHSQHHTDIFVADDGSQGKPSKNGTYINGNEKRLTNPVLIRENDTVQIGMTKLILRYNNTSINKIVHEVEESEYMKTVIIDIF